VYFAQTSQILLRQYVTICCTLSIKKRKRKWFQSFSGGKARSQMKRLLRNHNGFYWQT